MFRLTNKYTSILTYNNVSYLGITFFGLFLTNILNTFGILSSEKGIDYYAEAHLSKWNSWVHTLGMPYTFYGISCWVPALCSMIHILSQNNRTHMQFLCWYIYILHYITIDFKRALFCILFYLYPAYKAYIKTYSNISNPKLFLHGIMISTASLLFQETVGHYLGGDIPSRPEGVFNAILYSVIYSTYHII